MENFQHASHPLCLFLWLDVQLTGQVLKKLSRLVFMKTYAFLETKNNYCPFVYRITKFVNVYFL